MTPNNDYYYTGGGFSDWSGGSAGNYSSSSGSGSGGSYGGGISGGYSPISQRVKREMELGYPLSGESADLGPTFVNYLWLRWIPILVGLFLLFLAFFIYVLRYGEEDTTFVCGLSFALGAVAMMGVQVFLIDYYPQYIGKKMTERRFRRFYNHTSVMMWFCAISVILASMIPLLCFLFDDFVNLYIGPAFVELLNLEEYINMCYEDKSFELDLIPGIAAAIGAVLADGMIIDGLITFYRKTYARRLTYIMNKAGAFDEKKRADIARIAEINDIIKTKEHEIAELKQEIYDLEHPIVD